MQIDLEKHHIEDIFNGYNIHSISFYPTTPIIDYSVEIKPAGFKHRVSVWFGKDIMEIEYHAIGGYSESMHVNQLEDFKDYHSTYLVQVLLWEKLKQSLAYKITEKYGDCTTYEILWLKMVEEEFGVYKDTIHAPHRTKFFPILNGTAFKKASKSKSLKTFTFSFNMLLGDLEESRASLKEELANCINSWAQD